MSQDIIYMSAHQLVQEYKKGTLSPVEVTEAVLERISSIDDKINAYVMVDGDSALKSASKSEQRWFNGEPKGPIDGVPTSVKDLVLARGWPTCFGSKATNPKQLLNEDAPCVARLREGGAVVIGKTATPEFGWKGVTDSPVSGITRNPWNLAKTPGGSSGGASAALAAGMCHLAIGTDGGGSIRIPASFSGIFGLKPTFGRVPAWPAGRFGTLGHVGPMTRSVKDSAILLNVISQPDKRDWHALPYEQQDYVCNIENGVSGLKIAFSLDLGYADVDHEVEKLAGLAAKRFSELGAEVIEIDPGFDDPAPAFKTLWWAGAASALSDFTAEQLKVVEPGLAEIARQGRDIDLLDYVDAENQRVSLGQKMIKFHQTYDLLITPTLAVPPFDAGIITPRTDDDDTWVTWTPFTYPFNMTKQPAASVPCGFTSNNLPIGLQIVGPLFCEEAVLQAAYAYQSNFPLIDVRPPV